MPQALPAIIATAGAAIAGATAAQLIGVFVVNVALTALSLALQKKPRDPGPPPVNVSVNETVEFRRLCVGTRRLGGSFVFYRTSNGAGGEPNQILWYVIAYADHQCHDLRDAWADERPIADADINATTGAVSTAAFLGEGSTTRLWIWDHLGTQAQGADAQLTATFNSGAAEHQWGQNDRLRGVTYSVYKMQRDDKAWPQGAPQSFSRLTDGALLYDSRKDSTNGGSGAHRRTEPSTWEFTNGVGRNWALGVRWLLTGGSVVNDQGSRLIRYGLRVPDASIDDASFAAAANVSDESLSGANAPPSGAQVRYTLDLEVSCGQTRREILDHAIAAGAGELTYVGGLYRLYAGAYDAPEHSFTQDDLVGDLVIEDTVDVGERVNRVAGICFDAAKNYIEQTTPYRFNTAYDTQDGGRQLPKEIELFGVTDIYRAQRICEIRLRQARQMRRCVFPFGRKGMKVAVHETFNFSHDRFGWTNRVFRCVDRKREKSADGGVIVKITAKAEASSVYTDLLTADYETGTSVSNAIQAETPDKPSNLRTTGLLNGILVEWDKPLVLLPGTTFEARESTSSSMTSPTTVYEGPDLQFQIKKTSTADFFYQVRSLRSRQPSDWVPPTTGVLGKATSISTALTATVSPGSASSSGGAASQTTNTVTGTPSGGQTPYSHSWAFTAGGTGITIDTSTSAATSFSATGLTSGETRTGTARYRVTDNLSVQYDVTGISVSISRPAPTITAPDVQILGIAQSPTDASCAFKVDNDGHWYSSGNANPPATDQGLWCNPVDFAGDYEIRFTRTGGTETAFSNGLTLGTYLALTTDREGRLTNTDNADTIKDIIFTIDIRRASDQVVVATRTGNKLTAEVFTLE